MPKKNNRPALPQDFLRRRFFAFHGGDCIYIYPDNLNAKATLWLWQLRDLAVIGIGLLIAVLALTQRIVSANGAGGGVCVFIYSLGWTQCAGLSLVRGQLFTSQNSKFSSGRTRHEKTEERQAAAVAHGRQKITDYCISTDAGDLVFYIIKPTNISVLPAGAVSAKIRALQNTLSARRRAWSCWQ